jgi:hypothetical protein
MGLLELDRGATRIFSTRRHNVFETRTAWIKENILEGRASLCIETLPLVNRNQDSGFNSATGNHLWTFLEGSVKELAESSFCVVHLPGHGFTFCYIVISLVI